MTFDIYWAPEARCIATVEAENAYKAIRKAPQRYRKYQGELYARLVLDSKAKCTGELICPRHGRL